MWKIEYHPMLAKDGTLIEWKKVTSKFFTDDYFAEIKYDGSRYVLQRDENWKAHLTSRNVSVKTDLPVDKTANLYGYMYKDSKAMAGCTIDWELVVIKDGKAVNSNGSSEVNRIMLSEKLDLYPIVKAARNGKYAVDKLSIQLCSTQTPQ